MSYNKQYNTRFSGRFNSPGHFVSAGELAGARASSRGYSPSLTSPYTRPSAPFSHGQRNQMINNTDMQQQPSPPQPEEEEEMPMNDQEETNQSVKSEESSRPYWMKSRLSGVKKISNKERRRRQNENLRRLLTPKNALMVLNEMMPKDQQFKVEPAQYNTFKAPNTHTFCADLTIDGNVYQGYGDNKLTARNAAAEQAIRDLIIKKMNKAIHSDAGSTGGLGGAGGEEEALPMIQLASFALHKLFAEWEYEGHSVPQLKPSNNSTAPSESASEPVAPPVKKPKELPAAARAMHPCMLLTHMRPNLEYRELRAAERAPHHAFTMALDVDGVTYVGKGSNKKEARKNAAKAACKAIFDITFDEDIVQ